MVRLGKSKIYSNLERIVEMKLVYMEVNKTYAFFFGDSIIRLHNEAMFFETRQDAKYAAKACGLRITNRNTIKVA